MQELSGLPQEECSRAKSGLIRAWTTRRLDQVARHRGVTVPALLWEIYDVSEHKVAPRREFKVPDEVWIEFLETMRRVSPRSPREMQEMVLQFHYLHRMGVGWLSHELIRALMSLGPERATHEIALLLDQFLQSETPAGARKRKRLMEQFRKELRAIRSRS